MKHVLVVDDDRSVLDVIGRSLTGYRVTCARDPDEALTVVGRVASFDLLITDYLMPSMTGAELIGRIRERQPGLPVLILTAHTAILDQERPEWWISEAHLAKPVVLSELRDLVAKLIGPP